MSEPDPWFEACEAARLKYDSKVCPRCGARHKSARKEQAGTIHYGRVVCKECDFCYGFIPRPGNKAPRPVASLNVAKHGKYCEMCLLERSELPNGETIVGHHVKEHQHGGSNEDSNIWDLCTGCHELVHWLRKRHGHDDVKESA